MNGKFATKLNKMKQRLELLRAEASELQDKLKANNAEQTELMIAIYKEDKKLAEGDNVIVDGTKRGVIDSFKRDCGYVKPQVRMYKKDGTLGRRVESVWSFQKIAKLSE